LTPCTAAHQSRRRETHPAEPENAADPAAQHFVRAALVELAAPQIGVLDKKPLRRAEGERQDVLGHRLRRRAAIAGDRQPRRQLEERHPVDAGGGELQEPRFPDHLPLGKFGGGVVGEHRAGAP
jgi:hypothetical protein